MGGAVPGVVVNEWRRYEHDRLYVNDADTGEKVAFYDRKTGKLKLVDETRETEVLNALRPFLAAALPPSMASMAQSLLADPPVRGKDLAYNKHGDAVAARARELRPQGFHGIVVRLLRLSTEATSWELGAKGEHIVGRRLDKLKRRGWAVLHSVELRSGADIDHVVIGPPGVFTINTKHHRDARISVGDHVVWVNGVQQPYIRNSKHEARNAERRLSQACGMPVPVTAILAFVGAAALRSTSASSDVLVTRGEQIDRMLRSMPDVLTPPEQEHIFSVARHDAVWLA